MVRLTFDGNFCDIAQCRELPCPYDGDCSQKQVWERLKQFEDVFETPEKAAWAKQTIEMAFADDQQKVERLRELYKADKDGRVVILPNEDYKWSIRGDIAIGIIKANCRVAEAEKALAEMKREEDANGPTDKPARGLRAGKRA